MGRDDRRSMSLLKLAAAATVFSALWASAGPEAATPPVLVVAGTVMENGTISQNYNVTRAAYVNGSGYGYWSVKLKGPAAHYFYRDFIAVVTPIGNPTGGRSIVALTGSYLDRLNVHLTDTATGKSVKGRFSFVVYKVS